MMTRINRIISTFACALAVLISTCPTAQAEYQGELRRDLTWLMGVDNSMPAGKTLLTIHYLIGRRNGVEISREEIEVFTIPGGPIEGRVQLSLRKPGRGVRRIIIDVDPPLGGFLTVNISQATAAFPANIGPGFGRLVFDVVDAP